MNYYSENVPYDTPTPIATFTFTPSKINSFNTMRPLIESAVEPISITFFS